MTRRRDANLSLLPLGLLLGGALVAGCGDTPQRVTRTTSPIVSAAAPVTAPPVGTPAHRSAAPPVALRLTRVVAGGSSAPNAAVVARTAALASLGPGPGTTRDSGVVFRAGPSEPADTEPEPVILELQLGRLASRTVAAFRVRREALVPMSEFLQLAEIRYVLGPEGRLEATIDPGGRHLVIDVRRDTMSFGDLRVRLEPEFRLLRNGELYVGAERLGDLLGVRIVVSWADLAVIVPDPSGLPVGRRAQREAAREAFRRRFAAPPPELALGLDRARWDGMVVDYSFLAPSSDVLAGGAYSVAVGADALGGSLVLGASSLGRLDAGMARIDGSWTGVWRDSRWLKQLRVGDGPASGPNSRTQRGVFATNAPFVRPSFVGTTRYDGRLGPGWSVEAYRGSDLVAFDSADGQGRFGVDLPVRYGENPVDFVAYGPFGQIRQFNRTYRVLSELLPARTFEYGVSGGACRTPLCAATANLDLRYGLSSRATVQAGFDRFWRDTLPNLFHPYAAVTVAPATAWGVELDGVGGAFARGSLGYEPSLDLRLTAQYTAFDRGTIAPILTPAGQRSAWQVLGFFRPIPGQGFFYLESSLEQIRTDAGTAMRARLGASLQANEVRVLPYVRLERDAATRGFIGVNASLLPRPQWGPILGNVLVRSALEWQQTGSGLLRLNSYALSAARAIGPATRLEAGVSWARGGPGATLQLTLSSYLPMLRSYTAVTAPSAAPAFATQYVQGSLLWDRQNGRLTGAPGPSLERSGLVGRVFLDENSNGRYDPGEPLLPRVRVLVGSSSATTDSSGEFRVWDIVPFEPVLVAVDSLTLESPLLVPAFATTSIVPGPNRFRTLDIPIVQAGVVEGQVTHDGRGVGGVTLLLTERRSGARRSLVTFSDGGFYVLGVKPGDYDLTADPRVLDALHVRAQPLQFTLAPTAHGVGRSGIEIRLTSTP